MTEKTPEEIKQEIISKVIELKLTEWKTLIPLQPDNFKDISMNDYERLKNSLIKNHFAMPFTVWKTKSKIYIIDGHHKQKILFDLLEEGYKIPEKLPCAYLDCKTLKEAKEYILLYSSQYAQINQDVLMTWIKTEQFDISDLKNLYSLPTIDFDYLPMELEGLNLFEENLPPIKPAEEPTSDRLIIVYKNEEKEILENLLNCKIIDAPRGKPTWILEQRMMQPSTLAFRRAAHPPLV